MVNSPHFQGERTISVSCWIECGVLEERGAKNDAKVCMARRTRVPSFGWGRLWEEQPCGMEGNQEFSLGYF